MNLPRSRIMKKCVFKAIIRNALLITHVELTVRGAKRRKGHTHRPLLANTPEYCPEKKISSISLKMLTPFLRQFYQFSGILSFDMETKFGSRRHVTA